MDNLQSRTYLQGEVRYSEGKTTIKDFIKTLGRELTRQDWLDLPRTQFDFVWTFDMKREIWLPQSFNPMNIRLFKATILEDGSYTYDEVDDLINPSEYDLVHNIIIGKSENTTIGDKIIVSVLYQQEEFQRATFLETRVESGEVFSIAKLKSRPRGPIKIYEDTVQFIENEAPLNRGDNRIYELSRSPVTETKGVNKIVVYIKDDGSWIEVDEDKYVVDYFHGIVIFKVANPEGSEVKVDYGFRTGVPGTVEISTSKYKIYQDNLIDTTPTHELKNLDIVVMADYAFDLVYPGSVTEIEDHAIFKITADISEAKDRSKLKNYYWELKRPELVSDIARKTHILTRYGTHLNEESDGLLEDNASQWSPWSWYRPEGFDPAENDNGKPLVFEDWLPIMYWISHTGEHMNIVIQGDAGVDVAPYHNYIISYGYLGALENFKCMKEEDQENNFAFTFGGHALPPKGSFEDEWGAREGTGTTDISMVRTASNIPFQAHNVSFHTTPEFMDKHFITTSQFTGTHHFSEITVVHSYERERGKLQDVLIGDRSSIFHLDNLISNKAQFDYRGVNHDCKGNYLDRGLPLESKEKHWIMFNINAPYWFGNNSPNIHYGVAIRKK